MIYDHNIFHKVKSTKTWGYTQVVGYKRNNIYNYLESYRTLLMRCIILWQRGGLFTVKILDDTYDIRYV